MPFVSEKEENPVTAAPTSASDFDAYVLNMQTMNAIVREMKEIAELPSETPKDVNPLQRVEFPEEGGILTYMGGHEYPYRGFPFFEFVDKIDTIKKISRAFLSGLYHALKGRKMLLVTFLPVAWFARSLIKIGVYVFYRMVERFRIKPERYSTCMRELYRTFSLEVPKEDGEMRELRLQMRDLVCMVIEFDNAYRFRMQDIVVELDQEAIKTRPIKELHRLLDLIVAREKTQEIKDTWKLAKFFVSIYLRVDRKFLALIVNILSNLNLEKMRLSVEDRHYCLPRKDYTFGFIDQKNTL